MFQNYINQVLYNALNNYYTVYLNNCHGTDLIYTIAHYSILFPTIGWPTTSAQAANLAYLYTLPLYTFFPSLYHNVVIQFTLLQYCDKEFLLNYNSLQLIIVSNGYTKVVANRAKIRHFKFTIELLFKGVNGGSAADDLDIIYIN